LFSLLFSQLCLTSAAHTIDIQAEAILTETLGTHAFDGTRHSNRPKLSHFATDGTHLMTVAIISITGLIARRALKAVANDQTHLHKELQRIIQCGPTDRKSQFLVQFLAQLLERKMPTHAVDSIQDGIALRRLAMIVQFQVAGQYVSDSSLIVFSHFMWLNWLKTAQNYYFFFRIRQELFKKYLN
jgi:hypothetical protein